MNTLTPIIHVLTIVDGVTEEITDVVEIPGFAAKEFHQHFDVDPKRDPQMLDRYSVGPDDLPFLRRYLNEQIDFDFTLRAYFIEAVKAT